MSLFASNSDVEKLIAKYTSLQICARCNKYFTELDSIGMHLCPYHPGKPEYVNGDYRMSCCGEKMRPPYQGAALRYLNGVSVGVSAFSDGCQKRDCKGTCVPYENIDVMEIAALIPFMKPDLAERPGFDAQEGVIKRS